MLKRIKVVTPNLDFQARQNSTDCFCLYILYLHFISQIFQYITAAISHFSTKIWKMKVGLKILLDYCYMHRSLYFVCELLTLKSVNLKVILPLKIEILEYNIQLYSIWINLLNLFTLFKKSLLQKKWVNLKTKTKKINNLTKQKRKLTFPQPFLRVVSIFVPVSGIFQWSREKMQPTSHDCFEKPSNGCLSQREFGFFSILSDSYLKREQLTCESGSKCDSSLRLHLRLQSSALSVRLTTDSLSCHDAERRHPVRGSVWPIFALF